MPSTTLKADCLHKDIWREQGGYVDKGPFPQPDTDVLVQGARHATPETGEVTLRVTPVHGDTIYYDVGADASTASAKLEGNTLTVKDMRVSFLAVDSKGEHDPGTPKDWTNRITLKHRIYQSGDDKCMELQAIPDGSHPLHDRRLQPEDSGRRLQRRLRHPPRLAYGAGLCRTRRHRIRGRADLDQVG